MLPRLCLVILTLGLCLFGCAVTRHNPDHVPEAPVKPVEVPRPPAPKPLATSIINKPVTPSEVVAKPAEKLSHAKPAKMVEPAKIPEVAPVVVPSRVIFYREAKFVGSALNYDIYEQSTKRASLQNGSYFVLTVTPGKHSFTVREVSPSLPALGNRSELATPLQLEVKPGETRYVKGGVETGIMSGHPVLIQVSEQDAKTNLGKLLESH